MSQQIEVKLSFIVNTGNPEKVDWVIESIFGLLVNDEEIKRVSLNVKR